MRSKAKKILVWLGLSVVGLFVALLVGGYTVLVCHESGEISRYSPFCYICVSSAVRSFPLIGLEGEPSYAVNDEYKDGNKIKNASSSVSFTSNKSSDEIIQQATIYLNSIGYETKRSGCVNYPECPECCASFVGKDSEVSVSIRPKTAINGYTPAETNLVWVDETFRLFWINQTSRLSDKYE